MKPSWFGSHILSVHETLNRLPWWMTSSFILTVVCMNLLANKCIVNCRFLALDAGFLLSWIVFLDMDVIVKTRGAYTANCLSVVAMVFNLLVAVVFFLVSKVPGTWSEGSSLLINQAIDQTFKGTWYILAGSATAFICSAFVNNALNAQLGKWLSTESFGAFAFRSYLSTAIAQFVDNLIFAVMVSKVLFGWTLSQCVMCAAVAAAFELTMEIIASPLGYAICRRDAKHC